MLHTENQNIVQARKIYRLNFANKNRIGKSGSRRQEAARRQNGTGRMMEETFSYVAFCSHQKFMHFREQTLAILLAQIDDDDDNGTLSQLRVWFSVEL